MDTKLKIEYTKSGQEKLDRFYKEFEQQIVEHIKQRKYAPGDEVIEITASDIDEVTNKIKIIQPNKSQLKQFVLFTYTMLGVLITLVGLFYSDFLHIIRNEPNRLIFITSGIFLSTLSLFFSYYLKLRQKREKEIFEVDIEKKKIEDLYKTAYSITKKEFEEASTQYNDLTGSAALDFHGSLSELWTYFETYKIDLDTYEPLGIDVFLGQNNLFILSFLAIQKNIVDTYQKQNNGKLPVVSISVEEDREHFFKMFKRLNIKLSIKGIDKRYDIIDEVWLHEKG